MPTQKRQANKITQCSQDKHWTVVKVNKLQLHRSTWITHKTMLKWKSKLFLSIFYWLCHYSCPIFSFPLAPSTLHPPALQPSPPPEFMAKGCTYKFFGFSVSYTILNLSPSILFLLIVLLLPCTFPRPFSPSPSPLKTLHVISISLILFLF